MTVEEEDPIIIPRKEYEMMKKELLAFSDYQRLSSLLLWIGIALVILHIVQMFFSISSSACSHFYNQNVRIIVYH